MENLDPKINIVQENRKEIVFNIPNELQSKFKEFFNNFDKKLTELGVRNYSIQMTSLAEVF